MTLCNPLQTSGAMGVTKIKRIYLHICICILTSKLYFFKLLHSVRIDTSVETEVM